MKIGYPCINRSLPCVASSTFRLAHYTKPKFREAVSGNLECLRKILEYNFRHGLLFFRISSDLIPFASHPVCDVRWQKESKAELADIGSFIKRHSMRISMHPDQFTLINSPRLDVHRRSVAELVYHAQLLDAMGLDRTAKIQIHAGGLYGDKTKAMKRFANRYRKLPSAVKSRLVIENDDRLFGLSDCLTLHRMTGAPVLLDVFHHSLFSRGEPLTEAVRMAGETWGDQDGSPMVDYSSQQKGRRLGAHALHIDLADFRRFFEAVKDLNPDVMLEIKDKEKSALEALTVIRR